jgi:hypothetical protein
MGDSLLAHWSVVLQPVLGIRDGADLDPDLWRMDPDPLLFFSHFSLNNLIFC